MKKTNNPQLVICSDGHLYKVLHNGEYVLCRKLNEDEVLRDGDLCHGTSDICSTMCTGEAAGWSEGILTYYRPINTQHKEKAIPKYEYEYNKKSSLHIRPSTFKDLKNKPCIDEYGRFCAWYYETGQLARLDKETVEDMVRDEEFLWLDWLAENTDMVIRTEVEEKFDFKSVKMEDDGDGGLDIITTTCRGDWRIVSVSEDGYLELRDFIDADTRLKLNNKGEIIVKDSNGKILNP